MVESKGEFHRLDAVQLLDLDGRVVGNGLINYSSSDVAIVKGMQTDNIDVRTAAAPSLAHPCSGAQYTYPGADLCAARLLQ